MSNLLARSSALFLVQQDDFLFLSPYTAPLLCLYISYIYIHLYMYMTQGYVHSGCVPSKK